MVVRGKDDPDELMSFPYFSKIVKHVILHVWIVYQSILYLDTFNLVFFRHFSSHCFLILFFFFWERVILLSISKINVSFKRSLTKRYIILNIKRKLSIICNWQAQTAYLTSYDPKSEDIYKYQPFYSASWIIEIVKLLNS